MIKVIREKNPTDDEFLKRLKIESFGNNDKFSNVIVYIAIINNKSLVAEAVYDIITGHVELVITKESYRRKGVATYMYNYIEKDLGIKLKPSKLLLEDGKLFWKNRYTRMWQSKY